MTFRPIDASREIGVTVNTIRVWCRTYSEFLSEGATVEGETRVLTSTDLEILRYIHQLRNEKLQRPQIAQRLSETTFGHIESSDSPQIGHELALSDAPEAHQPAPAPIVAQDYVLSIERRFEALERSVSETRQSQQPNFWWFVIGLGAGLGLAAIAELFALVASRGH